MGRTPCSKKSNRSGKFIRKSLHPPCCNPRAVFPPLCSFLLIQFLSEFCRTVCVRVCGSGSKRTLWIEDRRMRFESVLVLNLSIYRVEIFSFSNIFNLQFERFSFFLVVCWRNRNRNRGKENELTISTRENGGEGKKKRRSERVDP